MPAITTNFWIRTWSSDTDLSNETTRSALIKILYDIKSAEMRESFLTAFVVQQGVSKTGLECLLSKIPEYPRTFKNTIFEKVIKPFLEKPSLMTEGAKDIFEKIFKASSDSLKSFFFRASVSLFFDEYRRIFSRCTERCL